jgi:hypothetical protein
MNYLTAGNKEELELIRSDDDVSSGYPTKGRHVGKGKHVPMTDDPNSPGWTRHRVEIIKHPSKEEYALPVDASMIERKQSDALALSKLSAAKPLLKEWTEVEIKVEELGRAK